MKIKWRCQQGTRALADVVGDRLAMLANGRFAARVRKVRALGSHRRSWPNKKAIPLLRAEATIDEK